MSDKVKEYYPMVDLIAQRYGVRPSEIFKGPVDEFMLDFDVFMFTINFLKEIQRERSRLSPDMRKALVIREAEKMGMEIV